MKELHHHQVAINLFIPIIARDGSMIMWTVGRLLGVGPSANKGQCQYNLIVYRLCHHLRNRKMLFSVMAMIKMMMTVMSMVTTTITLGG